MGIKEEIRDLPDGQEMDCYGAKGEGYLGPTVHVDDLKALAESHTALLIELRYLTDLADDDLGKDVSACRALIAQAEKL